MNRTRVAVLEPAPRLAARIEAMVETLGLDLWSGDGEPDIALLALDAGDEAWGDQLRTWLEPEDGPLLVLTGLTAENLQGCAYPRVRQRLVRPFDVELLGMALQDAMQMPEDDDEPPSAQLVPQEGGGLDAYDDANADLGADADLGAYDDSDADFDVDHDDIEIVFEEDDMTADELAARRVRSLAMSLAERVPAWSSLDIDARYREIAALLGVTP